MWFARWRRRRILANMPPPAEFARAEAGLALLQWLEPEARSRLRELAVLFLHDKVLEAIPPLRLEADMALRLALQACVPIVNLDLSWYSAFSSVVIYPAGFRVEREHVDEAGVVHRGEESLSGEAWSQGPVVLSWEDIEAGARADGYNVVVHEFAHKLDMLNGAANGMPPLHRGMDRGAWTAAFSAAYADLQRRLDAGEPLPVDAYGAESPGEFFAVVSEMFFELPAELQAGYPAVFEQLCAFYRLRPEGARPR